MGFKVKFDQSSIASLEKSIRARFEAVISSDELKTDIGELVVTDIRRVVREGKSAATNKSLKALSPVWLQTRSYLESFNKLSDVYQPDRKSRLSFTGEFLKSMSFKKIKGGIELVFLGNHPGYKTASGKTKQISNETLRGYIEEDREFIGLRKQIVKRINLLVRKALRRNTKG